MNLNQIPNDLVRDVVTDFTQALFALWMTHCLKVHVQMIK